MTLAVPLDPSSLHSTTTAPLAPSSAPARLAVADAPEGPIWVATAELAGSGEPQGVTRAAREGDTAARIWARLHGVPIGRVEVPMTGGKVDRDAFDGAVEADLAQTVASHLQVDGVPTLAALRSSGGPEGGCRVWARKWEKPISVVVSTKDRPELVGRTLTSLARLEYPTYEVLLVDGTTDGSTRAVFDRTVGGDDRFRYVPEPPTGLSRARNRGMQEARYNFAAFTDDDCEADPLWLAGIAQGFGRNPQVACVTGIVPSASLDEPWERYFDRRVWWSESVEPRTWGPERGPGDSPLHPFRAGIFGAGANFAVNISVVQSFGGFSPLLGVGSLCGGGGEDVDMFVRVLRAGHDLAYEPCALVWHEHRGSHEDLRTQLVEYGRGVAITGLTWLADPDTRMDVLRRLPRAVLYYALLLRRRGSAGDATRAPDADPVGGGVGASMRVDPMAWAEASGLLSGPAFFFRGYRKFRRSPRANGSPPK